MVYDLARTAPDTASRLVTAAAFLTLGLALVPSTDIRAGVNIWSPVGPEGGHVRAIAFDPVTTSTLYVGTGGGGVFRSADGGESWKQVASGLEAESDRYILTLVVNPVSPTTIYAATEKEVMKSTDGAATWAPAGASSPPPNDLAIDPAAPDTLYLAAAGPFGSGLFKSTNGGRTWTQANTGMNEGALCVLVDPTAPSTLYAGSSSGVFVSTNAASSWTKVSTGLPSTSISFLAIDPRAPATLYAATSAGLFRTATAGQTWVGVGPLPGSPHISSVAFDPTISGTLYAAATSKGVYKSSDSGTTWTPTTVTAQTDRVAVDPKRPGTVYAGGNGLSRSADGGRTWAPCVSGFTNAKVGDLTADPTAGGPLYAIADDNVFKRTSATGTRWTTITPPLGTNVGSPQTVAVAPSAPATLYVGECCGSAFTRKSTDAGASWTILSASVSVTSLAVDPRSSATVYAGDQAGFIYKTTDGGGSWVKKTTGFQNALGYQPLLVIDPQTPATLYAGNPKGIFRSTDGAESWTTSGGLPTAYVHALAIHPAHPRVLYASVGGMMFRSPDGAASWVDSGSGISAEYVQALTVDAESSDVFAGTQAGGVFRSTDGGKSWNAFNTGLGKLNVPAILVRGATLFAATKGSGVFELERVQGTQSSWILPSSARAAGSGGAFYTTDLSVINPGSAAADFTLKFLGNNVDGRGGAEKGLTLGPGWSATFRDVLGDVFGLSSGFGALRIASASSGLVVLGQTSTPSGDGTFGQSVPASSGAQLVSGSPCSLLGVREDDAFRTNLVLANATETSLDVDVGLISDGGASLGTRRYTLPALGMTQVTRVVRELGGAPADTGVRLVLSTPTSGGSFAVYASMIDNATNDPRTLLPACAGSTGDLFLPSSARAAGAGGAFYTTDLTLANLGVTEATLTLKFLDHDVDGRAGLEKSFGLAAGKQVSYRDLLGSVFGLASGYGAVRVRATGSVLAGLAQTSTPGAGGTFGQSVPVFGPADLIVASSTASIPAVREDAAFRTNLILANGNESPLDVDVALISEGGASLGSKRYTLPALGMKQVTRVVQDLGIASSVTGARLVLSTPTSGGAFAAYASVIDNVTNDPRTLLPR